MVISLMPRLMPRPGEALATCDRKQDCHLSLVVERQPCKLKVMGSTPIDGFLFLLGSKTNLQPRL